MIKTFHPPIETTVRMTWVPVNCCCQPDVLFGFLRLPVDGQQFKDGQKFAILDLAGRSHDVELKRLINPSGTAKHVIRLEELAIYSDDRPIEFWRRIAGFREVSDKQRPVI
jgi:hypothetical protein